MALCYRPGEKIKCVFQYLLRRADPKLRVVFDYVQRNWIEGQWKPENWSVYGRAIRTNNDCEALHEVWNRTAGKKIKFYFCVDFLATLGTSVKATSELLCHDKIERRCEFSSVRKHQFLFDQWKKFRTKAVNGFVLLDTIVNHLNLFSRFPVPAPDNAMDLNTNEEDPYDMDLSDEE